MNSVRLAVTIALLGLVAVAQQNNNVVPGKEYQVTDLSKNLPMPLANNEQMCGKFFRLTGQPVATYGKAGSVTFTFTDEKDVKGMMLMGWDKFITVIDQTKKAPTATYSVSKSGDPIPFHWTIRISSDDFRTASPCIPSPR